MSDYEPDDRPEPDDWENGDSDQAHLARWLDEHEDNDETMLVTVPPTSVLSIIHAGLDELGDMFGVGACREWLAQFSPHPTRNRATRPPVSIPTAGQVGWGEGGCVGIVVVDGEFVTFSGPTPAAVLNLIDEAFPEWRFTWQPAGDCEMVATISQREATVAS